MPSIYHGSLLRFLMETAVASLRSPRRHIRQWLRLSGIRDSKDAARHEDQFWNFVRRGERESAVAYAIKLAESARQSKDARMLSWISGPLGGLEQYDLQARCSYESRRILGKIEKDWSGEEVRGTLLIDCRHRTIAWPLRHVRFVTLAAARAQRCIVLCESRLVPLFQRSFPGIEVLHREDDADAAIRAADAIVTHQDLLYFFATNADAIADAFVPLKPDLNLVARFRDRYRAGERPLVGISWGSSNRAKEAPAFRDWAPVFRETPATFVSLQYGDVGPALRKLRRWTADNLINDESVDQMTDMDRFAAQVASLDAIISTSSTVVHLAGVLGVPSVVILDESLLHWPVFMTRTPWYPRTVLVHRNWRQWPIVMKEAQSLLATLLEKRRAVPDSRGAITAFDRT